MDSLHKSLYKQKPQLTLLETGRGRERIWDQEATNDREILLIWEELPFTEGMESIQILMIT